MLKSIINLFSGKKSTSPTKRPITSRNTEDIYILTSLSTFNGGFKSESDKYWTCHQRFVAYIDAETNTLHKRHGKINWQTEDHEIKPFDFKPMTIYRVSVSYVGYSTNFRLLEVKEQTSNNQLDNIKNEYFILDEIAGHFEYNAEYETLEAENVQWLNDTIYIDFEEVKNLQDAKKSVKHIRSMKEDATSWDTRIKALIEESQVLNEINSWFVKYKNRAPITSDLLINDLSLNSIIIDPKGDFLFEYEIKTHHYIVNVEGNANGTLYKAYLEE